MFARSSPRAGARRVNFTLTRDGVRESPPRPEGSIRLTMRSRLIADDSDAAAAYASAVQDVTADAIGHGSIILRGIDRTYNVGDAISNTRGREVNLRIGGREIADAETFAPVVIAVVWNFQSGAVKTELVLESPLLQVTR